MGATCHFLGMIIIITLVERQGSPPCLRPLVRFVFCVMVDMLLFRPRFIILGVEITRPIKGE
jgi:hypothetical protein